MNPKHGIGLRLDSAAADSVCPRGMCPQFGVEDSVASKAGVFYTRVNGGKLYNLGQTRVPERYHGRIVVESDREQVVID